MFIFGDDDEFSFDSTTTPSDRCGSGGGGTTESFLSNTFRDGGLPTTPTSPPTPVKVIKMETALSDQSPLVASTPFQSFVAENGCTTSGGDDERDGARATVVVATPPPGLTPPTSTERMVGVANCGEEKEEPERRVGEVLPVTMTTVEERPVNFSTTIVSSDDSPCKCGRASLGKRKREENSPSSDDRLCQCSVDQAGEDERIESTCVCEDKGENIKDCSSSKKLCNRPAALSLKGTKRINGVNGLNGLNSVYSVLGLDQIIPPSSNSTSTSSPPTTAAPTSSCSPTSQSVQSPCSSDEPDEDSSTPSPIDFTKVDPTLYDYDTRAPLFIPTQELPPPSVPSDGCHSTSDHHSNGGGSAPSTTSPDSSSTSPSSSSLPPSCSSSTAPPPPLAPSTADDAPCSASNSVTSPTLAITATSTTFSLPPPSSEYPLISSSNHDCSESESCSPSMGESSLIDCPSSDSKHSSTPSSCSLEGLVSAQNGNLLHSESERTDNENTISNGINGGVPSSPEGAENDFLEDIYSLLMT